MLQRSTMFIVHVFELFRAPERLSRLFAGSDIWYKYRSSNRVDRLCEPFISIRHATPNGAPMHSF